MASGSVWRQRGAAWKQKNRSQIMDEIVRAKFASSSWLINPMIGVTRWLNYCKIFGHLQQGKFAQSHNIIAKERYFFAKYYIHTQNFSQDF